MNIFKKCIIDKAKCMGCNFCREVNVCHSPEKCIGCLSCYRACPFEARKVIENHEKRRFIKINVDGFTYSAPEHVSVKQALEIIGYNFSVFPRYETLNAPCCTGGCWSCAVVINGELERSCIMPVKEDMDISTKVEGRQPLRITHGPQPHSVGGKATPWKEKRKMGYVEVAIWVAGCNLRCPQCQNYHVTYDNVTPASTPVEAARIITFYKKKYNVSGLAISGGEPTANRKWLIEYFKELKRLNQDVNARLHLDSNGTLLTPDYIDELVEAGCNNIGVEPKGAKVETFKTITGIQDSELARKYLENSWNAIKYISDNYAEKVYLGVGIPYNPAFMSLEEIAEIGDKIASIDQDIQVCVLDYFPTFRRRDIDRPSLFQMLEVKDVLNGRGLKYVIVQTEIGHFGP